MRIGIFTDVYKPYISGVVTAVEGLKKSLEEQGHRVYIVTTSPDGVKYKFEREERIYRIPGIPTGIYDYRINFLYPFRAMKKVKSWNLDMIHIQTEFGIGKFGKSMAKKLGIPVVHTFHTLYEEDVEYVTKGHLVNFSKKAVRIYLKLFLHDNIDEIIVPGPKVYDLLKYDYKIKKPISIIPSGIDIKEITNMKYKEKEIDKIRQKWNLKKEDFVILWVGRLGYEKHIDFLIESQANIVKKIPNAKLLIVGGGPEIKNLKSLTEKLNLTDSVTFVGRVEHNEIGKYYKIASVFTSASESETQGLTLVEALACEVPVLCINDASFKPIITHNKEGMFFKNKKEYCKYVEFLYNNPDHLLRMKQNTKNTAKKYSLKIYGANILNVYNKLIEQYINDGKYKKEKEIDEETKKAF